MFIGRQKELAELNNAYNQDAFQCALIYGKHHIGKTALIREFVRDKNCIWLNIPEMNEKMILRSVSNSIREQIGDCDLPDFDAWERVLKTIIELCEAERYVIVINEPQRALAATENFIQMLRSCIDNRLSNSNAYLILVSSDAVFVENQALPHCHVKIELKEFDYLEAYDFLKAYSHENALFLYSCIGGSPFYLSEIDSSISAIGNLERFFFKDKGRLYENPSQTLMKELREQALYNSILFAIASGEEQLNNLSPLIGDDQSKVLKYIKMMRAFGILERSTPYGDDPIKGRKGLYTFVETGSRFWFRYVIDGKGVDKVDINDSFFERPFEQICTQYLQILNSRGKLPFAAAEFGRWWGSTGKKDAQPEIDVVAADETGKQAILCECKWGGEPVTNDEVEALTEKKVLLKGIEDAEFVFFSRPGYTADAKKGYKANPKVQLLELKDLFI